MSLSPDMKAGRLTYDPEYAMLMSALGVKRTSGFQAVMSAFDQSGHPLTFELPLPQYT
jgi:hypothetical protein